MDKEFRKLNDKIDQIRDKSRGVISTQESISELSEFKFSKIMYDTERKLMDELNKIKSAKSKGPQVDYG